MKEQIRRTGVSKETDFQQAPRKESLYASRSACTLLFFGSARRKMKEKMCVTSHDVH